MSLSNENSASRTAAGQPAVEPPRRPGRRWAGFAVCVGVLTLAFGRILFDWAVFAAGSKLYSHIVLVPVVSVFLIWLRREQGAPLQRGTLVAVIPVLAGAAMLAGGWLAMARGWDPAMEDFLSLMLGAYYALLLGGALAWLGWAPVRAHFFAAAFLVFMIPFPSAMTHGLEVFLQHASAQAAYGLLAICRTPMVNDGLVFRLPGVTILVGQECSGIHSSLVLFVTSLVAGHLFLGSFWRKAALTLFVIPLAIARNAFRIFTIAMLSVYDDPSWLSSPLHHQGGPLFFALSLIPFFLLLWLLRRSEGNRAGGDGR